MAAKSRRKILVVEDDTFQAKNLQRWIENTGEFAALVANDLDAALQMVRSLRSAPAAAVIDIKLPVRDSALYPQAHDGHSAGLVIQSEIRSRWPACPVILNSGEHSDDIRDLCDRDPQTQFLSKLMDRRAMLDLLGRMLKQRLRKPRMFIVHGHDANAKRELADYLRDNLQLGEATILQDQAGRGNTILEKFELYAEDADLVFVLLTPDDRHVDPTGAETKRARQNVIFELGYFLAQLGRHRGRVIVLAKQPIEIPSDITGLGMIDISPGLAAADAQIRRELMDWL